MRSSLGTFDDARAVVAEIHAFARARALALRAWAPELRALLERLQPFLPPTEDERQAHRERHQLPFLLNLADCVEKLIPEDLCMAIGELETIAATSPTNPDPPKFDRDAIWQEIDPGSAPPWPEESPPAEGQA